MCCLKPSPKSVSDTQIFAADSRDGGQHVVYQMALEADGDVAMTLPIPVVLKPAEDAVRFISLEEYPEFFDDLKKGFPEPPSRSKGLGGGGFGGAPLAVVEVGDFEASFVPMLDDFDRLDERFRISRQTWDQIRVYADYGFVVFQLKPGRRRKHPMAFEFPRRPRWRKLFFPTVHIHGDEYHARAEFDHELYAQVDNQFGHDDLRNWRESPLPAGRFMKFTKAAGIIDRNRHVYLKTIRGRQRNVDTWV